MQSDDDDKGSKKRKIPDKPSVDDEECISKRVRPRESSESSSSSSIQSIIVVDHAFDREIDDIRCLSPVRRDDEVNGPIIYNDNSNTSSNSNESSDQNGLEKADSGHEDSVQDDYDDDDSDNGFVEDDSGNSNN